jgi:hypothetical protein
MKKKLILVILCLNAFIFLNAQTLNTLTGSVGSSSNGKVEIFGGHSDTKFRLYSTGNGSTLNASLDMWASEPGLTYDGSGIGNNVNGHPYYGRRNSSLGQSYIQFYQGNIHFYTSATVTTTPSVTLNTLGNMQITGSFTSKGNVVSNGQVDASPNMGAFRFYDGTIFNGGLGLGAWAGVGNSNDIVMYLTNNDYYVSNTTSAIVKISKEGNMGIGTTILSGISTNQSTLSLGGTHASVSGGIAYQVNNVTKGYQYVENDYLLHQAVVGVGHKFISGGELAATILPNGNLGIGTTNPGEYKLAVAGKIHATEIQVDALPWPDFVFTPTYNLSTLAEVENFITQNQQLPDVPSQAQVAAEGISLGEMNAILLQKIGS